MKHKSIPYLEYITIIVRENELLKVAYHWEWWLINRAKEILDYLFKMKHKSIPYLEYITINYYS